MRILLVTAAFFLAAGATVFSFRPELMGRLAAQSGSSSAASKLAAAGSTAAISAAQTPGRTSASSAKKNPGTNDRSSASAASFAADKPPADPKAAVTVAQAARPLSIRVNIAFQSVKVLDAKERDVKTFVCSSGKDGSNTPTGDFTISGRGKSFYNPGLNAGAYYWTRFDGEYLFHSVPFDGHYKMETEEAEKLGTPASHGCVRLAVEDAKWIYDNIPDGTKVMIY